MQTLVHYCGGRPSDGFARPEPPECWRGVAGDQRGQGGHVLSMGITESVEQHVLFRTDRHVAPTRMTNAAGKHGLQSDMSQVSGQGGGEKTDRVGRGASETPDAVLGAPAWPTPPRDA